MSKFLDFLNKASDDKFLAQIRKECEPDKSDVMSDVDSDSENDLEEEVSDPKKPQRNQSKSLIKLLEEYKGEECSSDTACMMQYVKENIKLLDVKFGKDIPALEVELTKLQKIISHMYPTISTQRGVFVQYTACSKSFMYLKVNLKRTVVI